MRERLVRMATKYADDAHQLFTDARAVTAAPGIAGSRRADQRRRQLEGSASMLMAQSLGLLQAVQELDRG